jgi:hypothetical protein
MVSKLPGAQHHRQDALQPFLEHHDQAPSTAPHTWLAPPTTAMNR